MCKYVSWSTSTLPGGLSNCTSDFKGVKETRVVSRTEQEYEPPYHYVLCPVSCFRHLIRVGNIARYEAGHNACTYPYNVDTSEPDKVVNLIDPEGLVNVENVCNLVSSAQVHTPAKQHSNESQRSV